ncbi:MAG: ABC transporter ATP-binding protein [Roseibacillus sp.]
MENDAIRTESIVKEFGEVRALNDVTIGIKRGELFFLLGGSGCGKTTLLRCIAGLEKPTSGSVFFDGEDVTDLPTHKREAAMVFQSYALWPHMTVGQNIAFGLEERKVPKREIEARVHEVLEMVKLIGYEDRAIDQMSGGQQQRVSLARALVVRPKCLLLDEPLSNLDAQLRLEMRSEIRRIVKENDLTGVYVTHDQAEALSMADRMAVMDNGHVEQIGTPQEIYRNPATSYVAAFIGETNLLKGTVVGIKGMLVTVDTDAGEFEGRVTAKNWSPKTGERAIVSVRPEAIRVEVTEGDSQGHILETTYLGDVIQYRVETVHGVVVNASQLNPRVILRPGERGLTLDVRSEDVVVLRD